MANVLKSLAKRINSRASAIDAAIQKKNFGSGTKTLVLSNEEIDDIMKMENDDVMKIVKSLEDSGLLIKGVSKTIKIMQENKKVDFLVCY